MKELDVNEMYEISGGIILEIALGLAFGAVCGVSAAALADKVYDAFN